MSIKFKYLILFLCLPGCSNNYQLAANSLLAVDWAQTRHISNSDNYHEQNKVLGKQPSTGDVNRHFVTSLVIINVLGEYVIPESAQDYFYIGFGSAEALNVINNYRIGVRVKF